MQILQSEDSTAQTLGELFGIDRRIKLMPYAMDMLPLMIRYMAEGNHTYSEDFPKEWECIAWLLLREYPDRIFLVIESPEFELVNRYIPDSLIPLFEPTFRTIDTDAEEQ